MKHTTLILFISLVSLSFAVATAQDKPFIVDKSGKKWVGANVESFDKKLVLTSGKSGKTKDFPLGSYLRVYKPMPNQYASALRNYDDKDFDLALRNFKKVEEENVFFEWERRSALYQVRILLEQGKKPDAFAVLKRVMSRDPASKEDPYIQIAILEMSKGTEDPAKFEDRVVDALAHPSRDVAAVAALWEVDRLMNTNPSLALVECTRVLEFFGDMSPELLAEANYKAGQAAKKANQNAKAERYFKETKEKYPNSSWAKKVP